MDCRSMCKKKSTRGLHHKRVYILCVLYIFKVSIDNEYKRNGNQWIKIHDLCVVFVVVKISITIDENNINVTNIAIYIHVLINVPEIQCDFNLFLQSDFYHIQKITYDNTNTYIIVSK